MMMILLLVLGVDPAVKLPQEITGQPGEFITIKPETNGKVVRFVALDLGLNLFPSDLLADKTATVANAVQPGRYRVLAYTALEGVPSAPSIVTVVVGGAVPPKPVNPVVPPQPADPLAEAIAAIYGGNVEPGRDEKRRALAGVYRRAEPMVDDTRARTTGELYLLVRQLSRQVLADGDLRAVRDRLNQELDGQLPTQADTVLTPELRGKIKAQFSRCAAALEGLGNG